ncbi:MAG: YraN family protein [Ruminococcaceae bacterium]|nr:YraN family protein [Oscillospiraceae bacterium]
MNKQEKGKLGEELTIKKYIREGYKLLEKNYRFKNIGEIDIILSKKYNNELIIVFCEVKTRKFNKNYIPAEAVTKNKQKKIINVAKYYLVNHNLYEKTLVRFDVAEVIENNNHYLINIIENAFY